MSGDRDGLVRSLQSRLARHAREIGVDPNLLLTRYAIERFLYRLSRSWFRELGYSIASGPDFAPGELAAERQMFGETLLAWRLFKATRAAMGYP